MLPLRSGFARTLLGETYSAPQTPLAGFTAREAIRGKGKEGEVQVQDFLKARSPSICHWRNSVKALKRLHNNTLSPVRSEGEEEEEEEDFA